MKPNPWVIFFGAAIIASLYLIPIIRTITFLFYSGWLAGLFMVIFGIFNEG
jgi:hypothetical protein